MKIKKRICTLVLAMLACISMMAVPAHSVPKTVDQPDGTRLTYIIRGDEWCHWVQTVDNVLLLRGDEGAFYYAKVDAQGELVSSGILAHDSDDRTEAERQFLNDNRTRVDNLMEKRVEEAKALRSQRQPKSRMSAGRAASGMDKYRGPDLRGKMNVLVILVNFADVEMSLEDPVQMLSESFNKKGYDADGHMGSVHDYFYDQSYGQLDMTFDVVGPVRLPKNMAYYGKNNSQGNDSHPAQMVGDACRLVDGEVDFSKYDNDNDGYVDQVCVVYAGYDEGKDAEADAIWSHSYNLRDAKYSGDGYGVLTLDGVKVNVYCCTSELFDIGGIRMVPIGTFCHEFSHCLGLMDLYDITYSGCHSMDYYDMMDAGMYNGPKSCGEVPCGYTAYERWYFHWLEMTELKDAASVRNMPSIGDEPVAYVIKNDNYPTEFFTLENRQDKGWFTYVSRYTSCHGMLISHIDYDANAWLQNGINVIKDHSRLTYVPADNNYGVLKPYEEGGSQFYNYKSMENTQGAFFPGLYDVTEFTDDSHYANGGMLYHTQIDGTLKLGKPITNISESNGLVSFDFKGGDDRNVIDAIEDVEAWEDGDVKIFDVSGNMVEKMESSGVYLVKNGNVTRKIVVR